MKREFVLTIFMKEHFAIILSTPVVNRILPPRYDRRREEHTFIQGLVVY